MLDSLVLTFRKVCWKSSNKTAKEQVERENRFWGLRKAKGIYLFILLGSCNFMFLILLIGGGLVVTWCHIFSHSNLRRRNRGYPRRVSFTNEQHMTGFTIWTRKQQDRIWKLLIVQSFIIKWQWLLEQLDDYHHVHCTSISICSIWFYVIWMSFVIFENRDQRSKI